MYSLLSVAAEEAHVTYIVKGASAGLTGAFVLAGLLLFNAENDFMPELDFIALLGGLTGTRAASAWALHFLIGALWGAMFAWLDPDLPGDNLRQRGVVFAGGAWLLMMLTLMPLSGAGWFGLAHGVMLPVAALALHAIFGAVMGSTYGWLLVQAVPLRYRLSRRT